MMRVLFYPLTLRTTGWFDVDDILMSELPHSINSYIHSPLWGYVTACSE